MGVILSRPRVVAAGAPPAGPSLVQSVTSADTGAAAAASLSVALGAGATAGNLLVAVGCSDATLSTPAGFTLAVSRVAANASYIWFKVAAGGETSISLVPSVSDTVCGALMEYSGLSASPLDQVVSTNSSVPTTGPVSPGTTAATTVATELVVAAVAPANFAAGSAPASPTWTNSYVSRVARATSFATAAQNQALFVGDLVVTATGAQSTSASWTNSAGAWSAVLATFAGA